jgi:hypothetical protein
VTYQEMISKIIPGLMATRAAWNNNILVTRNARNDVIVIYAVQADYANVPRCLYQPTSDDLAATDWNVLYKLGQRHTP